MTLQDVLQIPLAVVPVALSVTCVAWVTLKVTRMLGDPTAAELGHATLDPRKAMSILGTLIFPAVMFLVQGATGNPAVVFWGWGREYPQNPARLKLRGSPGSALWLLTLMVPLLHLCIGLGSLFVSRALGAGVGETGEIFRMVGTCNLSMAFVHLVLPVRPFAARRIVMLLLPPGRAMAFTRVTQANGGLFLVLGVILAAPATIVVVPSILRVLGGLPV